MAWHYFCLSLCGSDSQAEAPLAVHPMARQARSVLAQWCPVRDLGRPFCLLTLGFPVCEVGEWATPEDSILWG